MKAIKKVKGWHSIWRGVHDKNSTVEGTRINIEDGNPNELAITKKKFVVHHCYLLYCKGFADAKGFISNKNKPEA